jgi:hypothetical protein
LWCIIYWWLTNDINRRAGSPWINNFKHISSLATPHSHPILLSLWLVSST